MVATLWYEPFSRAGWLFEPKFDGEYCLATRSGTAVTLMSRHEKRLNEKYPALVEALSPKHWTRLQSMERSSRSTAM
jgi:ATP-dependent DNA ligase